MIFQEFLTKYNGIYIDFDGAYGPQCMDLMHQYCVEVLGIADGSVLAADPAKLVYLNFATIKGNELFEQIGNTPTAIPQEGDIVFWDGIYGHVAIFIEGNANSFRSFDQNYPTGSPCHVQNHPNYLTPKVLGWLRYKGAIGTNNDQTLIDQLRADRDKNWNLYQQEQAAKILLEDAVQKKQTTIDTLTKENLDLKEQVDKLMIEKVTLGGQAQILIGENQTLKIEKDVCQGLLANRKDIFKWSWLERFASLFGG